MFYLLIELQLKHIYSLGYIHNKCNMCYIVWICSKYNSGKAHTWRGVIYQTAANSCNISYVNSLLLLLFNKSHFRSVTRCPFFLVKRIRLINDIWVHLICQMCLLTSEYQIYGAYISIYTATLTCICTCSIRPSCARACLHVITQYNDTSPNDCTLLSKPLHC